MDLLPLLDECVELGDALEGELVHQVDDILRNNQTNKKEEKKGWVKTRTGA